jgi:2-phosphosulfolactate phosphatase
MKVETCFTPALIDQFSLDGKQVVVVDIFRATSCMVSGMAHGLKSIYPVDNVEKCLELGRKGYFTAGERGGIKIEEFNIGNSPFEYMNPELAGQSIAVTTTNGTHALVKSLSAQEIIIGAFLNLSAVVNYLQSTGLDTVIHCAGWKGALNIEDTLFAGALIDKLETVELADDSSKIAQALFLQHKNDLHQIALASSHAKRLANFGIEKDLEFCMSIDKFDVVPLYIDRALTLHK